MNKTFKIVFNKARGTLMVTNETTSSVQKKGVSLVTATVAALAILAAPSVDAQDINNQTLTSTQVIETDAVNSVSHSKFEGLTAEKHGGALVIKKDTSISNTSFANNKQTSTAKDTAGGAVFIEGAQVDIFNNSNFSNNTGFYGGAVNVRGGSQLTVTDSVFSGNHANGFGGAISDCEDKDGAKQNEKISINRSVFKDNSDNKGGGALQIVNTKSVDIVDSELRNNYSAGKGGAIQIENGAELTATDTVFSGNTAEGWGGAIRLLNTKVTISATKDLAMTGNKANVNGKWSKSYRDMGGFAYLHGNAKLTLASEKGSTLTIGDAQENDKTVDSIASYGGYSSSANELVLKGNIVINSSLEAFSDKITVADDAHVTMSTGFASDRIKLQADVNAYPGIAYDDYGTSELSLGKNATLRMGDLDINRAGWTGTEEQHAYEAPGVKITAGDNSTLNLNSLTVSTKKYLAEGKETSVTTTGYGLFSLDKATVNVAGDVKLSDSDTRLDLKGSGNFNVKGTLTVNGQMTATGTKLSTNALSIDDAGKLTIGDQATLIAPLATVFTENPTFESGSLTLQKGLTFNGTSTLCITNSGTYKTTFADLLKKQSKADSVALPNATFDIDSNYEFEGDTTVGALDAKEASVTVVGKKKLTIGNTFGFSNTTPLTSQVKNLSLGNAAQLAVTGQGTVEVETLESNGGKVAVTNKSLLNVDTLKGKADITVGSKEGSGLGASMSIRTLALESGSIFVDPLYGHSVLSIDEVDNGALKVNVIAGSGSLVTLGATEATSSAAVEKLGFSDRSAVVYTAQALGLASGSINIAEGLNDSSNVGSGNVRVGSKGALIVDQAAIGNNKVFSNASVTFTDDGKLGIVNATAGMLTLADSVSGLKTSNVATDTPFIEVDSVTDTGVTTKISATGGLGALASTGIQAMTRRADTVLAQTIADRTSLDQELAAGTNLWVDVTGERYEADKLENGGEFKSDMGYGAFGADFAVTQDITAGAAFQYGKGTLRSGVSSIKNSIDSYGVTAYGAMKFGEAKVVAEASYIKNENDITSSQTALNQSVDSEIYSVGVRGQHRFTAGNFQFVPSVGVRVSRLNTDAMQVGAVNIKKQEQTLVQVPIALRVNGFEQNVSGWSVAPSFKVAYVPTFGDKEISVLGADQTVIDTSPVQGDFGIRAQNGNLMVNANMMLGGGKDGTSSVGGKVGLKYVF